MPDYDYPEQSPYRLPENPNVPRVTRQATPYGQMEPLPRSAVRPGRRAGYPLRTKETARMRKGMSPEEYIKKKTFERPGYFSVDRPIQTGAPFPQSHLVAAGVGTGSTGIIEVTAEADFEAVKIMTKGYLDDEQNGYPANLRYLVLMKETATGRDLMNRPINVETAAGNSQLPLILPVTLWINRASTITLQFTNLNTDALYVYFTLLGIKYYYRDALNLTSGQVIDDVEYKRL